MAAKPKLTKKTLGNLDAAELRCIARMGMKLPTLEAYTMKPKPLVSWIYARADDFKSVDLSTMPKENFRPMVLDYVKETQEYLNLTRDIEPSWPPLGIVEKDESESNEENSLDEVVEAVLAEPEKPAEEEKLTPSDLGLCGEEEPKKAARKPRAKKKDAPKAKEKSTPAKEATEETPSTQLAKSVDNLHSRITVIEAYLFYIVKLLNEDAASVEDVVKLFKSIDR